LNAPEGCFDWLLCLSLIRVANDIRQCLVDRQNQRAAFRLRKSQGLRELRERVSDDTKHLRIAAQFHFEKQAALTHPSALSPAYETDYAIRAKFFMLGLFILTPARLFLMLTQSPQSQHRNPERTS
jgi:hypothetical protein